jgi:ribosomal protein L11 methyltransferase
MLDLFPGGFEELDLPEGVELAAYVEADDGRLATAFGRVSVTELAVDWAERWREFHRPVRVGPLWIGPPWLEPPAGALPVVIDPGRAFGTGAHPTTRLCLELLLDVAPGSLLDVGCGSGVLSIAAARLGFGPVGALDDDPAAVEATRANAAANGIALEIDLRDALAGADLPRTDVAVANIALEAVTVLAPRLRAPIVATSGYLQRDVPALRGYAHVHRVCAEGWAADRYARE